jgi:hypothetical protein
MKKEFIDFFKIDRNVVLAKLRSLRCHDIDTFTDEFVKLAAQY